MVTDPTHPESQTVTCIQGGTCTPSNLNFPTFYVTAKSPSWFPTNDGTAWYYRFDFPTPLSISAAQIPEKESAGVYGPFTFTTPAQGTTGNNFDSTASLGSLSKTAVITENGLPLGLSVYSIRVQMDSWAPYYS
jgi:hypothetical protein